MSQSKYAGDTEDTPDFNPEEMVPVPVDLDSSTRFSWRKLWSFTGPGFLMSIAYLDPGNLESDLQAGAIAGYNLIWVLFWATFIGLIFQILAMRLGVITGKDLAQICRHEYPRPAAMVVWIMTEIAIIGADIQEVVGSAVALNILFGLPLYGGVLITACDTFTFMLIHFFGVRKLEAFFGLLISIMAMCFAVQFGMGHPDGGLLMKGLIIPRVQSNSRVQAVSMLGAVIMPHNMFLHSSLVQSRSIDRKHTHSVKEAIFYFGIESSISLFVSFIINMFVVGVFAKGCYFSDLCGDASNIGLSDASIFLQASFGSTARILWAIGLLAAGQSSTMTGTFAGQYVMQGFLNMQMKQWVRVAITRSVALVPALLVAVAATDSMDTLSEYINVLQSIQLPFALLPVLVFNCTESIVTPQFKLSKKAMVALLLMVVLVLVTNIYLVFSFVASNISASPVAYFVTTLSLLIYLSFLAYLLLRTLGDLHLWVYKRCCCCFHRRRNSQSLLPADFVPSS